MLFGGTNERAMIALARTFAACNLPFVIWARSPKDHVLRSSYRDRVVATRRSDEVSVEILEELVLRTRQSFPGQPLVIVPLSEFLNVFLLGPAHDALARLGCLVPTVSKDVYMQLSNKRSCTELFSKLGIRTPANLSGFDEDLLPLVAKPTENVGYDGTVRYPHLIKDAAHLVTFLARQDSWAYFPQEFVRGESFYLLAYLSSSGDAFVHSQQNLAQQPGGKSVVLARPARFHELPIARRTIEVLLEMEYRGFAMIEYIVDENGPCFIELNPRPWGPLQLSIDQLSGIAEAFAGDLGVDDAYRFQPAHHPREPKARYMWLGGMLETWRKRQSLDWKVGLGTRVVELSRAMISDVYLRRDSWRIFLSELAGK